MDKRERLRRTIAGEPVDRPPVALWRHRPVDDQTPEGLAEATIHFQREWDWDFVKVTPSSSFCLRDWGVREEWRAIQRGPATTSFVPSGAVERMNLGGLMGMVSLAGSLQAQMGRGPLATALSEE